MFKLTGSQTKAIYIKEQLLSAIALISFTLDDESSTALIEEFKRLEMENSLDDGKKIFKALIEYTELWNKTNN